MKPRKSHKLLRTLLAMAILAVALLGISMLVISNQYPTEQTATVEFPLPDAFAETRKILIRTGATKQIITMAGDNTFLEEKWSKVGGSFNPFKPMHLELQGTMKVQSNDEYVGKPIVELTQDTRIALDEVHSHAKMAKAGERLLDYDLVTHFLSDDENGNTLVKLQLTQKVLTKAPWFAHGVADRRVLASANRALLNQKRAIIKLMDENR